MANLATATATSVDLETVATLTRAIASLTDQLKAKDIWAKSHEAEVAAAPGPTNTYMIKSYRTNNENYC
jgi:hypothetical protein